MKTLIARTEFRLFALAWLLYALHVVPGGGPNPNRYFDLTHSLVNQGTLHIDAYHENTHDKAFLNGHYYSGGQPGPSLAAIPAYLVFKAAYALAPDSLLAPLRSMQSHQQGTSAGFYQRDNLDFFLSSVWLNWFCLALMAAASVAALYHLLRQTQVNHRHALAASLLYAFGTPVFFFSTIYFSHVFAASIVIFSLTLAARLKESPGPAQRVALGALAGSAVLMESSGLFIAAAFGLYALWRWGWRGLAWHGLGTALPLAVLFGYNTLAFGGPFETAYKFLDGYNFARVHAQGWLGFDGPRLERLLGLTVLPSRGIFLYAPILILGPVGWVAAKRQPAAMRRPVTRGLAVLAAATSLAILGWIGSYIDWTGAVSWGPRHLVVIMPLLAFGVGHALARVPGPVVAALAAVSLAQGWLGAQFGYAEHAFEHWGTFWANGPTLPAVRAVIAHSSPDGAILRAVTGASGLIVACYGLLLAASCYAAARLLRRPGAARLAEEPG